MMPVTGILKQLLEYWQSLPRDCYGGLPLRSALNPTELNDILPKLTLLKRLDKDNVMVSVLGTESDALRTSPMIGMNAYDLASPDTLEDTSKLYETILDKPTGAVMRETVSAKGGKEQKIASLFLPLADENGAPNYIMSCGVYEHDTASTPKSSRQLMGHSHIRDIDFIDIGNGIPHWEFARPEPRQELQEVSSRWWERLLSMRSNQNPNIHLDA